ncbi:glutamate racemase [Mucilaginibacter litoreus]|uniref:Glutamate racemase n=1 Tax=Mucilaginibacter litoreus TaxID=1048221 RepID=A0ABW3APL6_9SPHI
MLNNGPIGVFDSGIGGLTVLRSIIEQLPEYDYLYLGDNGRAPYGNRSFNTIHQYTWECVQWMFRQGCPLIILACNTASAKALRTIQQQDLPKQHAEERVLGVIRPTAEVIGQYSKTGHVGVLGTKGTVQSGSYLLEIAHFAPEIKVHQQACPMWVPLIESGEYKNDGADYYIKQYLDQLVNQSESIDTVLLACTHYPLLEDKIKTYLGADIKVIGQGDIVAASLADYLQRHPEMEQRLTKNGTRRFFTTMDDTPEFDNHASQFFGSTITSTFTDVREGCA